MAHSLPEIEKDALRLSAEDRARLAVRLLSSLDGAAEAPEEIEKLWIAEAERRFQELRDGVVQGITAQKVFAELRHKRSRRRRFSTRKPRRTCANLLNSMRRGLKGSLSDSWRPSSRQRNGLLLTRRQARHLLANSASESFKVFLST